MKVKIFYGYADVVEQQINDFITLHDAEVWRETPVMTASNSKLYVMVVYSDKKRY